MKNVNKLESRSWNTILLCLLSTCFMVSCKKCMDYREQYTGSYNFKVYSIGGAWTSTWTDTTFYSAGKVILGSSSNSVTITIGNFSIEPDIAEDGTLSNCRCDPHYKFNGKFHSDKNVTLNLEYHGLGGGGNTDYTGTR